MAGKIACMVFLSALLLCVPVVEADSEMEKTAISEAIKWLIEVDEGKYADSWNNAAGLFKSTVKKELWVQTLQDVRKPLGNLISRETENAKYKTSLPGVPDGQYVVIQFKTSFENKKPAIETVIPMLDKDGNWRISGYYIK
jgi:hypothetical protein